MVAEGGISQSGTRKTHEELRPLSAEARQDLNFVFEEEGKQMVQGWRKLFYSTARLQDTSATKEYNFRCESAFLLECFSANAVKVCSVQDVRQLEIQPALYILRARSVP